MSSLLTPSPTSALEDLREIRNSLVDLWPCQVELLEDRVSPRPRLRRKLNDLAELIVGVPQIDVRHRQIVAPQTGGRSLRQHFVTAQVVGEDCTNPNLHAV